mmetsp:Transcript_17253/g.16456  ORF Transcript_17253/g.16456 Transcript_17253/m.16456 type:complete len:241 (-) Transcript_17253:104-826(-)
MLLAPNLITDPLSMQLQFLGNLQELIQHLINLLIILFEFVEETLFVFIELSVSFLIIIYLLLIVLGPFHLLLPCVEYPLVLNIFLIHYVETELLVFIGILVQEDAFEDIKVLLDPCEDFLLALKFLWLVLLPPPIQDRLQSLIALMALLQLVPNHPLHYNCVGSPPFVLFELLLPIFEHVFGFSGLRLQLLQAQLELIQSGRDRIQLSTIRQDNLHILQHVYVPHDRLQLGVLPRFPHLV